jgi:hypothetical protein
MMDEFNERLDQILEEMVVEYERRQEKEAVVVGIGMIAIACVITAVVAIKIDRNLRILR